MAAKVTAAGLNKKGRMRNMKTMKRTLAVLFSLVLVIAGVYCIKTAGNEAKAANAQADLLAVKVQVATDESNVIRFVSSVDCLDYKEVGFEVTPVGGTTKTYTTKTVYERIESTTDGVEYTFSPKVVDVDSEYFFTAKLQAEENVDYTVKAFATLKDGQKIYGATRCVGVIDGKAANLLNLTFTAESVPTKGSNINATYGKDNTPISAEVVAVEGNDVTVRMTLNPTELPSATKFDFGACGSTIYRNLYTKYTGTGTDDQTWYDVYLEAYPDQTAFTIATSADLYGFMNMMAAKKLFKNKTVYLISDIAANDNVSDAVVESWAAGTVTPAYEWIPSGNDSSGTRFQGIFDGQMHTLSGLYVNEDSIYAGIFGSTDLDSVVRNFYLTDSYFTTTGSLLSDGGDIMYAYLGSVAGENRGTIENIHSDAIVATSGQRTGGIIGVHNTTKAVAEAGKQAIINNCWFDGEVRLLGETGMVGGGIIGMVQQRESTMTNLLFTGKVTAETSGAANIGGIIGAENNSCVINMEDCVSDGTVTGAEGATGIGSAVGAVLRTGSVHRMPNVYAVSDMGALVGTGTADYPGLAIAKESLYGKTAYQKTLLDYEGAWCARTSATPVLRTFEEKYNAKDVVTDFSGVEQNDWYNANMKAYGLHTVSAFKAFSTYSDSYSFSGRLIYLNTDVDLNPGWTAPTSTTEAVTGNPVQWKPIGKKVDFSGTFDGRQHKISGAYVNETGSYAAAIFGDTWTATVCNFSVYNSYFKTTYAFAGGAIGAAMKNSTVYNIYSEAIVTSPARQTGGIVGRAEGKVYNCWFNGKISSTVASGSIAMGGIVGASRHTDGGLTVQNCLNTGEILYDVEGNTSILGIGGIYGWMEATTLGVTIENCVNAGIMNVSSTNGVGAIAGHIKALASGYTYTIQNCYTRSDCISGTTVTADSGVFAGAASGVNGTCTGHVVKTLDGLKGAGTEVYTTLDFNSTWTKRTNDVPVPTVFVGWIIPE